MSTLLEPDAEADDARGRRFSRALRVASVLSALLALVALARMERSRFAHDLQLAAESRARPGERLALRALLLRDVEAIEGPTLVSAPVEVRLLDAEERELARVALASTALSTLDGALTLPGRSGRFVLEATALYEGELLRCRRALEVSDDAKVSAPTGRVAGPLQQLQLRRLPGSTPQSGAAQAATRELEPALLVRVPGGACIPDRECELLVWVGAPGATLSLLQLHGVSLSSPADVLLQGEGLVPFSIVVTGPEATAELWLQRAAVSFRYSLRLPVGLAEVRLELARPLVEHARGQLRVAAPPGREHVIVDLFAAGRWRETQVVTPGPAGPVEVGIPELPIGLSRLQGRTDRLSAESAGARLLYVRAPGESEAEALRSLAARVAEQAPGLAAETRTWSETLPPFALDTPQRTAAFLLAPLESLRVPVPSFASGRPAQLYALQRGQRYTRFGVAAALLLSALVFGLSIGRRGLAATREAEAILAAASLSVEDQPRAGGRARGGARERVKVLALVLAVAAAFLAGALLIAAKPLWF